MNLLKMMLINRKFKISELKPIISKKDIFSILNTKIKNIKILII